jgi:hypothetical protein
MTSAFLMILYKLRYATVASPLQQSTIMYAGFSHSYDLLKVPKVSHTVQIQTALYLSMVPQSQTCSERFYTIMLQAEMSIHQQFVTKCKLTFLQCPNIESSTNSLPPCHKVINASFSGPKDSSHISTSMASFFLWLYHTMLFQTLALCFGVGTVKSAFITSHVLNRKSSPQQHIFHDIVQAS